MEEQATKENFIVWKSCYKCCCCYRSFPSK